MALPQPVAPETLVYFADVAPVWRPHTYDAALHAVLARLQATADRRLGDHLLAVRARQRRDPHLSGGSES